MPINRLNSVQYQRTLLIEDLNRTTFERAYIDAREEGSWGKLAAKVWFALFGTWGCENVDGHATYDTERRAIESYQSSLAVMLRCSTHIVDPKVADHLRVKAQTATDPFLKEHHRILQNASTAFHRALRERITQLKDSAHAAQKNFDEAECYQAGLVDISKNIKISNRHSLPEHHVHAHMDSALDHFYLTQSSLATIADEISVDDILDKGAGVIVEALELHFKTFGKDPEIIAKLPDYIAVIRSKVTKRLGDVCQKQLQHVRSESFYNSRMEDMQEQEEHIKREVLRGIFQLQINLDLFTKESTEANDTLIPYIMQQLNLDVPIAKNRPVPPPPPPSPSTSRRIPTDDRDDYQIVILSSD